MYPFGLALMARIVRGGPSDPVEAGPVESGRPRGPVRAIPALGPEDRA